MAEKIEFDLEVRKDELNSALDTGSKKASELNGILKTAAGVFVGNLATKGFELLTKSISNSIDFAKESIKAYSEQEDALNRLSQSLRASGDFSDQAIKDFSEFASELQRTSKFGDEVVLSQLALAKSFGATNKSAKELVQAAAELSATFGGTLEENVVKLGKTLSGEIGRLGQLVPQLKELTQEQLKSGEAASIIIERFGGAASAELNTYAGSVIASANAFSDLQEEIGAVVVDVLRLRDINNFLASVYQTLTDKVLGFRDSLSRGSDGFKETEGSINRLSEKVAELTEEIEIQENRLAAYSEQAKTSFSAAGQVVNAKNNIKELRAEYEKTIEIINKFSEEQNKIVGDESKTKTSELTQSQKVANQEIISLREQLRNQERSIDEQYENQRISDEFARNEAEIQRITAFEAQKTELEFQLRQQKIQETLSGEDERLALLKLKLEEEIAIRKLSADMEVKLDKNAKDRRVALANQASEEEKRQLSIRNNYIQASALLATALFKQGSKEAFVVQKAAALASIAIEDAKARASAVAASTAIDVATAGVGGKVYLAKQNALITSNTALAIAGVAASALQGFQDGGIVGATRGSDNRLATVRNGEMVLNADQQKSLFDAINSGSLGGGEIVIQIDGRTIATAVRDQIKSGFRLV